MQWLYQIGPTYLVAVKKKKKNLVEVNADIVLYCIVKGVEMLNCFNVHCMVYNKHSFSSFRLTAVFDVPFDEIIHEILDFASAEEKADQNLRCLDVIQTPNFLQHVQHARGFVFWHLEKGVGEAEREMD